MESYKSIGFIGAGNMATALIKGIINSGIYNPAQINASDSDKKKIKNITEEYGITGVLSNRELVSKSDIILLAVKPQVMAVVLEEIKEEITDGHLVISIAAGVTIKNIQGFLGHDIPVIRVMPNTPALIQKGISAVTSNRNCTDDHKALAEQILNAVGRTIRVDEKMMDAVTALSGSGPGFLFKIMECFVESAEEQGFDKETALLLITQTFLGSIALAHESNLTLSQLREMVTSPGGTTQAGLTFLDKNNIAGIIKGAVDTARKRSVELGQN
jgi:pyrroline-5-carboxylate reductase